MRDSPLAAHRLLQGRTRPLLGCGERGGGSVLCINLLPGPTLRGSQFQPSKTRFGSGQTSRFGRNRGKFTAAAEVHTTEVYIDEPFSCAMCASAGVHLCGVLMVTGDYPVSLFSTRVLASAGAVARSGRNSRGTATARRGWLARRAWRLAASRMADGERRKGGPRGAGQANALGQKMELGSRGFPCEATYSPWREEHCFLGVQKQHGRGRERRTSLEPSRS